jgi:formylglycine-generating enzyme required for sulfatase activity
MDFTKNGYRLPTEAEWEYACRAGSTTDYYWNRSYQSTTHDDTLAIDSNAVWNYYLDGPQQGATKLPNAFGLYDMSGNVCEWCNDWWGSYNAGAQTDPTGPSTGSYRVLRGGGSTATTSCFPRLGTTTARTSGSTTAVSGVSAGEGIYLLLFYLLLMTARKTRQAANSPPAPLFLQREGCP